VSGAQQVLEGNLIAGPIRKFEIGCLASLEVRALRLFGAFCSYGFRWALLLSGWTHFKASWVDVSAGAISGRPIMPQPEVALQPPIVARLG
jgi:hypothetical protein